MTIIPVELESIVEVVLDPFEQASIKVLAEWRTQYNEEHSDETFEEMNMGDPDWEKKFLWSIGAEWAFCKLINVFPDTSWDSWHRPDAILPFPDCRTADVKHKAPLDWGDLLVKKHDRHIWRDLYVLMRGSWPAYRYGGYATREMVANAVVKDFGHKYPCYMVPKEELLIKF